MLVVRISVGPYICAMQVVLLTDGMDTRAYRLNWPSSTIIYDISPENVFNRAAQKLKGRYCSTVILFFFKIS